MQSSHLRYVERPQVAFRVGVTGAAALAPLELGRIHAQVAAVLKTIHEEVERCATVDIARRVYEPGEPILRLITPLGDGADRLVAEEALKFDHFQIEVPLPFERQAYEATFAKESPEQHAASIGNFTKLLAAAGPRVLTLDGNSLDDFDRPRSYEAIGRLVVRNCDLLIAIWDDEQVSRGRGGTADTVHFALRANVPVWWIHAAKNIGPKWLKDILDLPRVGSDRVGEVMPDDVLCAYIRRAILPPVPVKLEAAGIWQRIMFRLRRLAGIQNDPLLVFLRERVDLPNRKIFNLHQLLIGCLRAKGARQHLKRTARHGGGWSPGEHPPPVLATEPAQERFGQHAGWLGKIFFLLGEPFRRNRAHKVSSAAAGLSGIYQHRYRSSYTAVFICGAFALISAVIGSAFDATEVVATFTELLMLSIILGVVVANELLGWHERYISYRMLGELLRMWQHLRGLGWALPASRVTNLADSTRRGWVGWFFAAIVRACPLTTGHFSEEELAGRQQQIIEELLAEQIRFHERRGAECEGAIHILGAWGRGFFFSTLVFVLIRVEFLLNHSGYVVIPWLSLLCALLPAASAAFFGIRAYEEFEVLAEQSVQMHDALSEARTRIRRIRVDRPLASQLLGMELFDIATVMLSDIGGWAQLFRMKAVEA